MAKAGVAFHHAGAFVASTVSTVDKLLGQKHHPIPKKVADALRELTKYKGDGIDNLLANYRKFKTKARKLSDHFGYQEWHRKLDAKIVEHIHILTEKKKSVTAEDLMQFIYDEYMKSDLKDKFPLFREDLIAWCEKYKIVLNKFW